MHKFISIFFTMLIIVAVSTIADGQSFHSKEEVRNMFPANTKNLWINYLSGSLDGGHTMDMIIGTDGKTCRGLYTMRSSKATFYFDGSDNNKQLQLIESDAEGKTTGFLIGHYDGQNFNGTWSNRSKKIELKFALHFVNAFNDFRPEDCRNDQWELHYTGTVDGKDIFLSLAKNEGLVTCRLVEQGIHKMDVFTMAELQRIYNFNLSLPQTVLDKKTLVLDTFDTSKITVSTLDDNQYEVNTSLSLERKIRYECNEYSDFSSRLKLVSPVIGNPKFDLWIRNKGNMWVGKSVNELADDKTNADRWNDRWSKTAFGWVELDLYDDDIMSGTLHFQKSWSKGIEKLPFIFSLKAGKEISIKEVFKPKYNYTEVFNEAVERYTSSTQLASNTKLWFGNQSFKHCTLTREGISLRTDFSIIHGEEQVIIPYADVIESIKIKSIKKDIMLITP